VKNVKIVKLWL